MKDQFVWRRKMPFMDVSDRHHYMRITSLVVFENHFISEAKIIARNQRKCSENEFTAEIFSTIIENKSKGISLTSVSLSTDSYTRHHKVIQIMCTQFIQFM